MALEIVNVRSSRLVVGIEGAQVRRADDDALPAPDLDLEIAGQRRRHVLDLGAQVAAVRDRQLAILHLAGHRAGTADIDQMLDEHLALHLAVHLGPIGADRPEQPAIGMHQDGFAGDLALDIAIDLDLPAIADAALDDGIRAYDHDATIVDHQTASSF